MVYLLLYIKYYYYYSSFFKYFYYCSISHFGSGVNNRSRKKTGLINNVEVAEDEILLVESSSS